MAPKPEPKKDTTLRLLKPGVKLVLVGGTYGREKDLNPLGSKDKKEFIKNITKKSFVPFQAILDQFKDQKLPEKYLEKFFESEIFKEIPGDVLNPVLPKQLVKKPAAVK